MRKPFATGFVALAAVAAIVGFWIGRRGSGARDGEGGAGIRPSNPSEVARTASRVGADTAGSGPTSREATPEADAPGRAIRLVGESGDAVAGASLTAFADAKILVSRTTSADGAAEFPSLPPECQLWVVADGHLPCGLPFPPPPERDVVINSGNVISGFALVDDRPPTEPLEIGLRSDRPMFTVPLRALTDVKQHDWTGENVEVKTGPGGAFSFEGLPDDFAGTLLIGSWDYVFVGKRPWQHSMRLERPQRNLVLRLMRVPKITARIVGSVDHEPLPNLSLTFEMERAGVDNSFGAVNTDAKGRFTLEWDSPGLFVFRVWSDAPATTRPLFEREIDTSRSVDLGDVSVVAKRTLALEVVDGSGAPIAGAVAAAGWEVSAPTDASGRTELRCAGLARECSVGALGYLVSRFELPPGEDVLRRVALAAGTLVEVMVAVPEFDRMRGGIVRATSPTFLFDGDRAAHGEQEVRAGAEFIDRSRRSEAGSEAICHFFTHKPVRWNGLRPGVPITFELLSKIGDPLASATVTLAPEEHRAIELRASPRLRTLRGIVVDREGRAVRDVTAKVQQASTSIWNTVGTDDRGAFRFKDLCVEEVFLSLVKAGYVPFARTVPVQASDAEEPVRIVLERGRTVRATAEDSSGRPVPIDGLRVEREGVPKMVGELDGNVWLVKSAPVGESTLVLTAAGREWRRDLDGHETDVRFVLPALGSVVLRIAKKAPNDASLLVSVAAAGVEPELWPREWVGTGDELRFPGVAPGACELRVRTRSKFGRAIDPKDLVDTKKTIEVHSGETTAVTWDGTLH